MFLSLNYLAALIIVLTLHEFSHAWVANRLGDPTPYRMGRLSLNPLRHLDPLGTLMLFLAGFGWGKPVPVNPRNFDNPDRDEALTAFAGPLMNLAIALLVAIPLTYLPAPSGVLSLLAAIMDVSLVLFLFNMLPFAPLDGSKFLILFVPRKYRFKYQEFLQKSAPYFLLYVILDLYLLDKILGFSIVWTVVSTAYFWLKTVILVVV